MGAPRREGRGSGDGLVWMMADAAIVAVAAAFCIPDRVTDGIFSQLPLAVPHRGHGGLRFPCCASFFGTSIGPRPAGGAID